MQVRIWGTRGSIPTPGRETVHFGGNTSCVELETDAGELIILDCGTGVRLLGERLIKSGKMPVKASILISHAHWDHIQGFPFLGPIFQRENEFSVFGPKGGERSLKQVLATQMEFTFFPISLDQLASKLSYHHLSEGIHRIGSALIKTQYLHHPAVTLGYRIEADGVTVAYLCDHEPFSDILWRSEARPGQLESFLHDGDRRHAAFMQGADLVIHDSQYTVEEYPAKKNWGHSHYEYVVGVASAAGVRRLLLTHHDPSHQDEVVSDIEVMARKFAESIGSSIDICCAYEGLDVMVPSPKSARHDIADSTSDNSSRAIGVRILVAEDDPDMGLLIETVLKEQDFSISLATDGKETLRMVDELQPDLLILDLMMPEIGGLEVLRMLRANPSTADLPVLVITAKDEEDYIKKGFDSGANDYLTKPFKIPQLTARVRACLSRLSK